jgi:AAA family ATP:ADP antiporter
VKWINRILHIQPGEEKLTLILGFVLLFNMMALQISGIVAVSGFLSQGGVNQILLVFLIDCVFIILTGSIQSLIVDKYDRIKLIAILCLAFALIFILLRVMFMINAPTWLIYLLMYLTAEQQFIFFPLVFWVLANDAYSMAQSKRLFPLISGWGFIGKLLGILIAGLFPFLFTSLGLALENILFLNVFFYLIAFVILLRGTRNVKIRKTAETHQTVKETLTEGWSFIKDVHVFRYFMFAIFALAICDTILEFRFLVVGNQFFPGQGDFQSFYSIFRLVMTVFSFAIQTFLSSYLIQKMSLKKVFFIMPLLALLGAGMMIVSPLLPAAVLALITLQTVRDTTDDSARKSFQALVPEERRGRVSTFMSNYLPALGTIVACIITGVIVLIGLAQNSELHIIYLIVAAVAAAFAIWAIFKMRAVYDNSMMNWRLKRRQRGTSSVLDKLDF